MTIAVLSALRTALRAARADLVQATYAWGNDLRPDGMVMANTWQGHFPYDNNATPPVRVAPTNPLALDPAGSAEAGSSIPRRVLEGGDSPPQRTSRANC